MQEIINVKNLRKTYKLRTNKNLFTGLLNPKYQVIDAVKDISFCVNSGESLAFLGPNGAGKTTTTKMLTGVIYPSGGSVNTLGFTPYERKEKFLMQIGLVMGNKTSLSWDLTGEQNFDFIKRVYQIEEKMFISNLGKLAEILKVSEIIKKQVRRLSLGERMKLELIGAILHSPKILFLDEPTIGLDITSKKNIRKFLREIQKDSNITIILTSHDMDDVETVCDRVLIINKGQKVYDNKISILVEQYNKKKFIKFYINESEILKDLDYAKIIRIEDNAYTYEVTKENVAKLMAHVLDKNNVYDIDIVSIPLEEMIEDIFNKTIKKA